MYTGPNIITNGLVLALDAANNKSYSGSGTTWSDLSGNGNSGNLTNGPTFNSANGGSIVFDGTNDYVLTTTNTAFSTNPFSIDMWFKPSGSQPTNSTLICIAATAATTNWQISFNTNTLVFQAGSGIVGTSTYTALNSWVNFTVVRESTSTDQTRFYINGNLDVSFTVTNNFTDVVGYRIGMNRGSNAFFGGNIANTKIYNKALPASEVLQNYNAQKSRFNL